MDRFRDFHFVEGASPMSTWIAPTIGLVVYICAITILSRRSGPPIKTKTAEVLHNSLLVVLSFVTMVGVVVGAIRRGREDGWEGLICSPREPKSLWDGYLGGWSYLFYLTKYYELLDTVILALKKKPLLPLHVYHHAVMLFVGWSWFAFSWLEGSWWCAFLNSLIHTAMYSYYLLTTLGLRVWWKKYLTVAQMIQFMTGNIFTFIFFYKDWRSGCGGNAYTAGFSIAVNNSFLLLFAFFYRSTYRDRMRKNSK